MKEKYKHSIKDLEITKQRREEYEQKGSIYVLCYDRHTQLLL